MLRRTQHGIRRPEGSQRLHTVEICFVVRCTLGTRHSELHHPHSSESVERGREMRRDDSEVELLANVHPSAVRAIPCVIAALTDVQVFQIYVRAQPRHARASLGGMLVLSPVSAMKA
jgi:hypothetical protein